MNRRGFITGLVKAVAAAAVAARLVREEEILPLGVNETYYDPVAYLGEWKWINIPASSEETGHFRGVMKGGVKA